MPCYFQRSQTWKRFGSYDLFLEFAGSEMDQRWRRAPSTYEVDWCRVPSRIRLETYKFLSINNRSHWPVLCSGNCNN